MNILFIKHYFVGFMFSEIPIISEFGYFTIYKEVSLRVCFSSSSYALARHRILQSVFRQPFVELYIII